MISYSTRQDLRFIYSRLKLLAYKLRRDFFHRGKLGAAYKDKKNLLVNFGAGDLVNPAWVNVDFFGKNAVFYYDLREPLPFADGAVRHIHCEHFLEHLQQDDAKRFMSECRRILMPGGTLRLILPDAEKYIRAYSAGDEAYFAPLSQLGKASEPFRTRMEIINQVFRMGGDHLFAWDFETLHLYLTEAGFSKARLSTFGDIAPELNVEGTDAWRLHESIYLNATK